MKRLILSLICFILFIPLWGQSLTAEENIFFNQQMSDQQKSWNAGDLDGYMSYYWESDSLIFISGEKRTLGWQKTRDNYESKYPDATLMGTLEYGNLFFYKLDKNTIITTGTWKLQRNAGNLEGSFTLIWRKLKGRWVIIIDHTV
jgi:ketosteroid isomerase-like protein